MVCPVYVSLCCSNGDFVEPPHWIFKFKICQAKRRFGTVSTVPTEPFDSVGSVARVVGPDTKALGALFFNRNAS